MIRVLLYITFIFLFETVAYSQQWNEKHWGFQFGISANIGTHIQHFGFKIQGYYTNSFIQVNVGNHIRFHSLGLGERKDYISQRINIGVVAMGGRRIASPQLILDGLNHQTQYEYAVAYNYLWYFDNAGTSQASGGIGAHIQQFSVFLENDILAGFGRDRFRTNFVGISYHNQLYNIGLYSTLWTGETRGAELVKSEENDYHGGYKILSNMPYGKTSHGIIYATFDYQIFYSNTLSASIGIDSERIRNALQNKFMHDKVFLPKKWRKPNPNYPMLDTEGNPVFDKKDSKPSKLYLQFGLNAGTTY